MKTLLRIIDALFSDLLNSIICWIGLTICGIWLGIVVAGIILKEIIG